MKTKSRWTCQGCFRLSLLLGIVGLTDKIPIFGSRNEDNEIHDRSAAGSRDPRVMKESSGAPGSVNPMWTDVDQKDPLNVTGDRLAELKIAAYGNIQVVTSTKRDVKLDNSFTLKLQVARSLH